MEDIAHAKHLVERIAKALDLYIQVKQFNGFKSYCSLHEKKTGYIIAMQGYRYFIENFCGWQSCLDRFLHSKAYVILGPYGPYDHDSILKINPFYGLTEDELQITLDLMHQTT